MTDHDLRRLKELPVPLPREGSKATAVNAALEAYSPSRGRLANVKPVSALFEKAQGSFALGRPTDASATAGRSKSMRYRLPMPSPPLSPLYQLLCPSRCTLPKALHPRCSASYRRNPAHHLL